MQGQLINCNCVCRQLQLIYNALQSTSQLSFDFQQEFKFIVMRYTPICRVAVFRQSHAFLWNYSAFLFCSSFTILDQFVSMLTFAHTK